MAKNKNPIERTRRLAEKLSDALNGYSLEFGGEWGAHVFPSAKYEYPVVFEDLDVTRIAAKMRPHDPDFEKFLRLVSTTPKHEMDAFERLKEEARLTWQISRLLDRMNEVRHVERREWPAIDREALKGFVARLETLANPPSADTLQAMSDEELAEELRTLETRIRDTRKAITLVHAVKVVRDA